MSRGTRQLVAVCFSGQARTLEECYPSISDMILDRLEDYRVFVHIADDPDSTTDADRTKVARLQPTSMQVGAAPLPIRHFQASQRLIDGIIARDGYRGPTGTNTAVNILRQWQTWHLSNSLKRRYEEENGITFDWVLRIRPDSRFETPIEDLNDLDRDRVHVPGHDNWYGINDRFAIGSSAHMDTYTDLINHVEAYAGDGPTLPSVESVLRYHLQMKGIPTGRTRVRLSLLRTDGRVWRPNYFPSQGDDRCPWPLIPRQLWLASRRKKIGRNDG